MEITSRAIMLLGHILGFVLWFGITLSVSMVSLRAKRTGDRTVMAFAYRSSQSLLKGPALVGALLAIVCGFGLTGIMDYGYFEAFPNHWMFQMQVLGVVAFLAMILLQLPNVERLARAAEASAAAGEDSAAFVSFHKRHALITSLIGLMLFIALVMGALKPF